MEESANCPRPGTAAAIQEGLVLPSARATLWHGLSFQPPTQGLCSHHGRGGAPPTPPPHFYSSLSRERSTVWVPERKYPQASRRRIPLKGCSKIVQQAGFLQQPVICKKEIQNGRQNKNSGQSTPQAATALTHNHPVRRIPESCKHISSPEPLLTAQEALFSGGGPLLFSRG